MKNKVIALAAAAEAGTGLLLLAWPLILVRLLFDSEIVGATVIIGRFAGVALIGLGVACWPGNFALQPLNGMLTYSALAMLYLAYIGVRGEMVGLLSVAGSCAPCNPRRSSLPRAIQRRQNTRGIRP